MNNIVIKIDPGELCFSTNRDDWENKWSFMPDLWSEWENFKNNTDNEEWDFKSFCRKKNMLKLNVKMQLSDKSEEYARKAKKGFKFESLKHTQKSKDYVGLTKMINCNFHGLFIWIVAIISEKEVVRSELIISPVHPTYKGNEVKDAFIEWFNDKWRGQNDKSNLEYFIALINDNPMELDFIIEKGGLKNKLIDYFKGVSNNLKFLKKELFSDELMEGSRLYVDLETKEMQLTMHSSLKSDEDVMLLSKYIENLFFTPCENSHNQWQLILEESCIIQKDVYVDFNNEKIGGEPLSVHFQSTKGQFDKPFDKVRFETGFDVLGLFYEFDFDTDGVFKSMKLADLEDDSFVSVKELSGMDFEQAIWGCYFLNSNLVEDLDHTITRQNITSDHIDLLKMLHEKNTLKRTAKEALEVFYWFVQRVRNKGAIYICDDFSADFPQTCSYSLDEDGFDFKYY